MDKLFDTQKASKHNALETQNKKQKKKKEEKKKEEKVGLPFDLVMIVDKVFFYKHTPQSQHISNVLLATF
jgi:ribosomal protein S25